MKKIFVLLTCLILLILLAPPGSTALESHEFAIYQVNSSGVTFYDRSGVTTATVKELGASGVSSMARRSGYVPGALRHDIWAIDISKSNGLFEFKLKDATTSQISSDPDLTLLSGLSDFSSGTTGGFYVKIAPENSVAAWSTASFVPIWRGVPINSGDTPWPTRVQLPKGNYMRAYFLPSGLTPFGLAEVEATSGFDISENERFSAVLISSLVYSLNANSGTSTSALDDNGNGIPTGAQYGEMQVIGNSGNSIFYTRDNSTIDQENANYLQEGDYRSLNRFELDNLKMEAPGAIVVRIDCYTDEP